MHINSDRQTETGNAIGACLAIALVTVGLAYAFGTWAGLAGGLALTALIGRVLR